jgi:hypothetical protein
VTVLRLLEKAERNLRSATVLLQDEDRSGACNRVVHQATVFVAAMRELVGHNEPGRGSGVPPANA